MIGTFGLPCHGVSGFGSPESQAPGSLAGRERGSRRGLMEPRGWFCRTPKLLCSGTGRHPVSVYQALGGIVRVPGTVVQDCAWGRGASKRNGQRPWPQDLTDQGASHTPASLQACRTIGGRCPAGVDMCGLKYDLGLGLSEPHRWLGGQSWPADPGPQHHVHCFLPPNRGSLCVCVCIRQSLGGKCGAGGPGGAAFRGWAPAGSRQGLGGRVPPWSPRRPRPSSLVL